MNPWKKDKIKVEIGTKIVDYTYMPEGRLNRIGFGVDCDYGGHSRIEGLHTISQLEDLFSDIIIDLKATLDEYNMLEPKVNSDE